MISVLDRLAGGGEAIQAALGEDAPYMALTTIDEIYPERPDRCDVEARVVAAVTGPVTIRRHGCGRGVLLELFGELAEYEHLEHELRATEGQLARRCSASARRPRR